MAASTNINKDTNKMKARLMQECEDLWLDVNKLQAQVASTAQDGPVDEGNPMMSISEVKIKALKGQLATENEREHVLLPTDPETLRALLREELESSIQQLEQTLEVIQGQRRELEDEVKWEQQVLHQQKQMQATLQNKVTMARNMSKASKTSLEADLTTTKTRMEKEIMRIMKELKYFSKKHFPHPDATDSDAIQSPNSPTDSNVLPLLDVLENFMNQSVEKEDTPYIEIDDTYWPPYIELLLRCGVLQRHEQNSNLLRLTPFHFKF
ncbi:centromere protein K-like isoform X2 [Apostichopus japonicus]